jgi:hypothetical protein
VREHSIYTATADPSQPCNFLFVVTSLKQFLDELVTHDAIGMITLTRLFNLLCPGRRGNRKRLSGMQSARRFEDMSIS